MKKLLTGIGVGVAATLAAIVVLAGYGTAGATSVHHQDCPEGWEQVVSQPPNEGFTVIVAYSGNLWIKVATQHFEVPVVSVGDVIGPEDVSSWPTNQNGKYQEISHVDYCIPPETTTTVPETTVPETTVPETTVPDTTVAETTVPETTAPATTTPTTTVAATTVPSTQAPSTSAPAPAPQSMPVTGGDNWSILAAGVLFLLLGGSVLLIARRTD
jgi:hypothetical protein